MADGGKIFVLDTNVILHDSACLHRFEEHDIVVPITVLEELDRFKKGTDTLSYHARQFVRALDGISEHALFAEGVSLGSGRGRISIRIDTEIHPDIAVRFNGRAADHRIINAAYQLHLERADAQVVLVTKDVNLRMKAKSVGILAQDYTTDQVRDITSLYCGHRLIEHVPAAVLEKLCADAEGCDPAEIKSEADVTAHEYLILRNGASSVLATFDPGPGKIRRVEKSAAYGIVPRNVEQTFALNALLDDSIALVSLSGRAGTGKTLLALAAALQCRKNYRQIYVARPVVSLSNRDIGFLPGDVSTKLDPYMQPLYDNLGVIQDQYSAGSPKRRRLQEFLDEEKLVVAPLTFIRGRSLVNIFFIVDEAQNLTPHEVKTIITRAGEGTKVVFTGDIFQIDHPYLNTSSNGLSYLISRMQGRHLYAHINLEKGERSELADLAGEIL